MKRKHISVFLILLVSLILASTLFIQAAEPLEGYMVFNQHGMWIACEEGGNECSLNW